MTPTEIKITVPIRRWVGPSSSGLLSNLPDLISKGVVSSTFKLRLPTYDVDQNTRPVFDCDGDGIDDQLNEEQDDVYWNGEKIGSFQGSNNSWTQFIKELPISKLKFPNVPGETAINTLEIKVDEKNRTVVLSSGAVGCEVWLTEVDWAQVTYKAMSPVAFVHGINNAGVKFGGSGGNSGFVKDFKAANIPVLLDENGVSVTMNERAIRPDQIDSWDSIHDDSDQLAGFLLAQAQRYGVESVHLVTHSKGGLDSRGLLRFHGLRGNSAISVTGGVKVDVLPTVGTMSGQAIQQYLSIESLTTINTPHAGSPAATAYINIVRNKAAGIKGVVGSVDNYLLGTINLGNPADPTEKYNFDHPPGYMNDLAIARAWRNNYDPNNQYHRNIKAVGFTDTDYGASSLTPIFYSYPGRLVSGPFIGSNVTLFDRKTQTSISITANGKAYLANDGVVPVWSSGFDPNALITPANVVPAGPRLVGSREIVVPNADHSSVAELPATSSALIQSGTGGFLNWRLH
ncbi:hypothetical protein [Deinococcus sp.]|uniref:esterase/lipase family protein n=1 Tax=Deinococcus sp. TaxID=47478 RepID=UPI0025DCC7B8|nr:hypothetical protein [Deinococcus sp.]